MTHTKFFQIPPMVEALESARIVAWNVQPGQAFSSGDILLEIETDKSTIEVPASESGKVVEILAAKGELVAADTAIAKIEVEGEAEAHDLETAAEHQTDVSESAPPVSADFDGEEKVSGLRYLTTSARPLSTPVARKISRERGIDIAAIQGTGPNGRVTQLDVMAALQRGLPASAPAVYTGGGAGPELEELNVDTIHGPLYARRSRSVAVENKATVVLIHGLFGDGDTWAGTIASAARAGLPIVAIDLPCHGRSAAIAVRLSDIVEATVQAIRTLCAGPIALVGHSLGGAVVVRAASQLGSSVSSVTLFSPVGLGTEINQAFIDGMLHARSEGALRREIGKLTAGRVALSTSYMRKLAQWLELKSEVLTALCREISSHGVQQIDLVPDVDALACPVTIVHGRRDDIIPWQHVLNVSPRVALHLVPDAGHMPQSEAMTVAAEVIERAATRR